MIAQSANFIAFCARSRSIRSALAVRYNKGIPELDVLAMLCRNLYSDTVKQVAHA